MNTPKFSGVAAVPGTERYDALTEREQTLYERDSLRDCFYRDYTRILH